MLYRNYPREFRYQFFSTKLPRGGNCFVCRSNPLTGLEGLPSGGKLIVAPYVTGMQAARPGGGLGTSLENDDPEGDAGLDAKWTPNENTAIDATINPDFSQIESDVAQIGVNERFALFFPEKRPFFLEGIELFATPITAVYTRTITSPRWGVRGTGKFGQTAYTALVVEDRGGGSVILPEGEEGVVAGRDVVEDEAPVDVRDGASHHVAGAVELRHAGRGDRPLERVHDGPADRAGRLPRGLEEEVLCGNQSLLNDDVRPDPLLRPGVVSLDAPCPDRNAV
jgi:hypothetical protein